MTTDSLAGLYDQLTPRERVPLIFAAAGRGDEVEQERLVGSAKRATFSVGDHAGFAKALLEVADFHMLILLDLAANYWQWWGLWMIRGLRGDSSNGAKKSRGRHAKDERLKEIRSYVIARYYASRLVAHVDGRKCFCQELNLDMEFTLKKMPGWETVVRTEGQVRELAFTAEQAISFVCSEMVPGDNADEPGRGPEPVETVEEVARGWHKMVEEMVTNSAL